MTTTSRGLAMVATRIVTLVGGGKQASPGGILRSGVAGDTRASRKSLRK
jgi:hypothetical protein